MLGDRYREAVRTVLDWADRKTAIEILGDIDALKLRSSLTLFEAASGDLMFGDALNAFYEGPDEATLRLLNLG